MTRKHMRFTLIMFLMFAGSFQAMSQERVNLEYRRAEDVRDRRAVIKKADLPRELMMRPGEERRAVVDRRQGAAYQAEARRAATWAAQYLARGYGYREYYRIGFHKGIRAAFDDPANAEWDYRQGLRAGRRDRGAEREGQSFGRNRALDIAERYALEDVSSQWRNLNWRPERRPPRARIQTPNLAGELDLFDEPSIKQVFEDNPLYSFNRWQGRSRTFYKNWRPDPWRLYKSRNYRGITNDEWRDAAYAFKCWRNDSGNKQVYDRLSEADRARFRGVFNQEFARQLTNEYNGHLAPAWNMGQSDGWAYGQHLAYEWHFRRGYHEGAVQLAQQAAEDGFFQSYSQSYRRTYEQEYDRWADNAVVEITELIVTDENDDGVFEPGERITVGFEAVNYGGRNADDRVVLQGAQTSARPAFVQIPARESRRFQALLNGRLGNNLRLKNDHNMVLKMDVTDYPFVLHVTRPVQFIAREVRVAQRDNLAGYAKIAVGIENISSKPVPQVTVFHGVSRYNMERLAPGQTWFGAFEVDNLNALSMIGGRAEVDIEIRAGETRQDYLLFKLPEQATDLRNRDLVESLMDLARQVDPDQAELEYAYRLMVRRISADWKAAIKAKGNPYRRDRKKNTEETAMGQLVLAYEENRATFANDRVFNGLRRMLQNMAKDLPGWHPGLRSGFKKLANKIS